MKKYSFFQRFKYWLDNKMSKGTIGMITLLGMSLVVFVIILGILTDLVTDNDVSLMQTIWDTFANTTNAWIIQYEEASGNILHLILMAIAGIVGILVTSVLIGIFSNGIEEKVTNLKKGKSKVLEDNHIVILGFNRNTYKFVDELCNSGNTKCIVIAGNEEKDVMEERINNNIKDTKDVKIVCRSIDSTDLNEIACCSIENAKAVVIVDPSDAAVVKTILTVSKYLKDFPGANPALIAIVNRGRNLSVAKYAGAGKFFVFHTGSVVAKIMAQACTQKGISKIFSELFSFDGSEIYFIPCVEGQECNYKELATRITNATPLGIVRNGTAFLNPHGSITLQKDDQIIVLAQRVLKLNLADKPISFTSNNTKQNIEKAGTNVGIIGYTHYINVILSELDEANCNVTLTSIPSNKIEKVKGYIKDIGSSVEILKYNEFCERLSEYDHIIQLSGESFEDSKEADNQSVYSLLNLRNKRKEKKLKFNTVVELKQQKTKDLLEGYSDSEYIITNDISSLIASQLVFNPQLATVFKELISYEGNEITLEEASDYVEINKEYQTKQLRAIALNEDVVYLGYIKNDSQSPVLDPNYDDSVNLQEGDKLILLSDKAK